MSAYQQLIFWQKSFQLVLKTYAVTKNFPSSEIFTLTSQLRRSAISIPSNIAEGHGRHTTKEYRSFLQISLGSANEVESHLLIARELKYINTTDFEEIHHLLLEVLKLLKSTIRSLEKRTSKF